MYIRLGIATAALAGLASSPALSFDDYYGRHYGKKPHIQLTIDEPGGPTLFGGASFLSPYGPYGKHKKFDRSLYTESGWTLSFRMAAPDAVGLISTRLRTMQGGPDYETLVLKDPDDCLDLSHAIPSFTDTSMGFPGTIDPFENNCPAIQDEKFMLFNIDYDDAPAVRDTYVSGGCEGPKRDRLVDDEFANILLDMPNYKSSNKAYVVSKPMSFPNLGTPVGPFTGGFGFMENQHLDCYGYGADEDVASLVVMVNTGAARIFDGNLNYDNTRIRNMAGFVSGVGVELIDRKDATTVVAHMPVRPGMLTPLTFFDIDRDIFFGGGDPIPPSFNILRKIEDGPIETFAITGAQSDADIVNRLIELTPSEFTVEIRAVVVEGDAPEFIDDTNGDGKFTAADLKPAYKLLSNEAVRWIDIVTTTSLAEEEDAFECPPLIFVDLNMNDVDQSCDDGDGTSRSAVRRPR